MHRYTYTGDAGRYYPQLGLTPQSGETYDLERNPGDGLWEPAKAATKKTGDRPEKEGGSDA